MTNAEIWGELLGIANMNPIDGELLAAIPVIISALGMMWGMRKMIKFINRS